MPPVNPSVVPSPAQNFDVKALINLISSARSLFSMPLLLSRAFSGSLTTRIWLEEQRRLEYLPSSPSMASNEETSFQLGISASNAGPLQEQGKASGERRGKSYGPESFKIPNAAEETRLTEAAKVSAEKRQHITENISKEYRKS
ncbi:hypothetical protein PDIDSM_7483 [Penicillium digitatum]|nr:hypothetical protein PDIDSM_7483 [Penicillium digitatum]